MMISTPSQENRGAAGLHIAAVWLLAACMAQLHAQAPPAPHIVIGSASLDALEKKLTAQLVTSDKTQAVNAPLSPEIKNHRTLMFHRDAASLGEIHEGFSDFGVVRSGSGSVRFGGTLVNRTVPTPGEPRGTGLEGAKTARFSEGDLVYVPAGMPHQFVPDPGKHLTVMLFKPVGMGPQDLPSQLISFSAAQLNALDKELATKLDETRGANTSLVANGDAATEMALVRSGSGAVILGGKVVNGKVREPGEVFGPSIEGGTRHTIAAGDVVYIPDNTAHLFVPDPGQPLSVLLFRFPSK
jgi:uncharacterized RmlC-like cupin family protein